jgi:hypothetical protein
MDKAKNLHEAQAELQRHVWGTYIDKGVSIALGGDGIVTPGCEACRKRIDTNSQYLQHLADDVLPGILRMLLSKAGVRGNLFFSAPPARACPVGNQDRRD